jgi:hypothetical protein
MSPTTPARGPRCGEFFAPLPLAALALCFVNDLWLKPAFHSELTGKLSDVAVCFFMPLFLSELLGIFCGWPPRRRLLAGAIVTASLFAALEVVAPFTRLALDVLDRVGPYLGIQRRFRMTSDWTDLACLLLVPLSFAYGRVRLRRPRRKATPGTLQPLLGDRG